MARYSTLPFALTYKLIFIPLVLMVCESYAHFPRQVHLYQIPELSDEDIVQIDLFDGTLDDWKALSRREFPDLSLRGDFFGDAPPGYYEYLAFGMNLELELWWGWHQATNRIYVGFFYMNMNYYCSYLGNDLTNALYHDGSLEFIIDGDHSGGRYGFAPSCCANDEQFRRLHNAQAQRYIAIAEAPDNRHIGYMGAGASWVNIPPYTDGSGHIQTVEGHPLFKTAVVEFYITPFDSLVWNDPGASVVSSLFPGKIIGFHVALPDYAVSGELLYFATLSDIPFSDWSELQNSADLLVDAILLPHPTTPVEMMSWGRIKRSIGQKVSPFLLSDVRSFAHAACR